MRKSISLLVLLVIAVLAFFMGSVTSGQSNPGDPQQDRVLKELAKKGPSKSMLGAIGAMAYVVHDVEPGSPAEKLGLQSGDLITFVDHKQVLAIGDVLELVGREPGTSVEIQFIRPNFTTSKLESYKGNVVLAPSPAN